MVLILGVIPLFYNYSVLYLITILTAILGIGVAILIIQQELGIINKFTEELCASGKNTDCDAVMKSKGSKLSKLINWSNAGIIYFVSLYILLITWSLGGLQSSLFSVLAVSALCTIPFTIYSVYYQWSVVKKWCPLCLLTVGLLWIQVISLSPGLLTLTAASIHLNHISLFVSVFLITGLLWTGILKPSLLKNKELTDRNHLLSRFKNNIDTFISLLQKQKKIDTTPFSYELQVGNNEAPIQLIMACSTHCGPCAKAHKELYSITRKNDLGLSIRFALNLEDKDDPRTQVVKHILQFMETSFVTSPEFIEQVLNEWFELLDYRKFSEIYVVRNNVDVTHHLKKHSDWIRQENIQFTPTIFINGKEVPEHYTVSDLKLILKELNERVDLIGSNSKAID